MIQGESMTVLTTQRLVLRPWRVDDEQEAQALYRYASDPDIGPSAGWSVHHNVEESMGIIRKVLATPETFAITAADEDIPIGSIGLSYDTVIFTSTEIDGNRYGSGLTGNESKPQACEFGYWIAKPYWGRGLVPEAVRELFRHGFEDLGLDSMWARHDIENVKSKRVMHKCGMHYEGTMHHVHMELLPGEVYRDEDVRRITRDEWLLLQDQ
jgi:RimJ/RimL family protein N-acetyltransferase